MKEHASCIFMRASSRTAKLCPESTLKTIRTNLEPLQNLWFETNLPLRPPKAARRTFEPLTLLKRDREKYWKSGVETKLFLFGSVDICRFRTRSVLIWTRARKHSRSSFGAWFIAAQRGPALSFGDSIKTNSCCLQEPLSSTSVLT